MLSKIVKDVMIDKILCSSPPSHRSYGRRSSLHGGGGAGRGHYQPGERNIWYICAQRQNLATWTCYSQPPILGQRFSKKLLEFSAKFKLTTQKTPKLHYISMNLNFHWYFYEFPWLTHFVVNFFSRDFCTFSVNLFGLKSELRQFFRF